MKNDSIFKIIISKPEIETMKATKAYLKLISACFDQMIQGKVIMWKRQNLAKQLAIKLNKF